VKLDPRHAGLVAFVVSVPAGMFGMLVAAVYSLEAATEPSRGWPTLGALGVVGVGVLVAVLVCWTTLLLLRRRFG
jgi:multisubunit Na+/H+ antiporter MnhB subunit